MRAVISFKKKIKKEVVILQVKLNRMQTITDLGDEQFPIFHKYSSKLGLQIISKLNFYSILLNTHISESNKL